MSKTESWFNGELGTVFRTSLRHYREIAAGELYASNLITQGPISFAELEKLLKGDGFRCRYVPASREHLEDVLVSCEGGAS